MDFFPQSISAIVLAAGQSKRMGKQKLVLPWGNTTVLGKVLSTLRSAQIHQILVVTGDCANQIDKLLDDYHALRIFNPNYANGEMLESLQLGLSALSLEVNVTLVCLGDQPQIEASVVAMLVERFIRYRNPLIVPSYQMRRGHPWLVERSFWREIITLEQNTSMRDFFNRHARDIDYLPVETPSILKDLDTPDDYSKEHP